MSTINDGGPAFPIVGTNEQVLEIGMTLRQYAAIKLRVPQSGTDWLDEMIVESRRQDLFAAVSSAPFAHPGRLGTVVEALEKASDVVNATREISRFDAMLAAREAGYALDDGCEPVEVEAALASRDAEIERLRHALELAVPVMDAHAGPSRLAEFVSAGRTAQAAREAFDEAAEMRRAEWHAEMRADAFGHPHE